jgi:hypothetical protein
MEPRPLERAPRPAYPTRREFLAQGTVLFLATMCGGCGRFWKEHPRVAPLFEHGEGRGATGCDVVLPPVFLSEEEAMLVIKEELAKEGIELGAGTNLPGVTLVWSNKNKGTDHWLGEPDPHLLKPISLDAVDATNRVGIEFVSEKDCIYKNRHYYSLFGFSIGYYPTKEIAQAIAREIDGQAGVDLRIGVFYDPISVMHFNYDPEETKAVEASNATEEEKSKKQSELFDKSWKRRKEEARSRSRAMLRRQAQDFVAWMKSP